MKNCLLTIVFLLSCAFAKAQTGDVVLCEGFATPWLDDSWSIAGDPWVVWYISNTANAGGNPKEMFMYPDYNFNGTTRLVSPQINLKNYDYVDVQFNQSMEVNSSIQPKSIGIAISADGNSWKTVWQDTISGSILQTKFLISFDMEEWTEKELRFSLFFTGSGTSVNNWYIDNIIVYADRKNKFGHRSDSDENGLIAAKTDNSLRNGGSGSGKTGKAMNLNRFKKSKNKYARIVRGKR